MFLTDLTFVDTGNQDRLQMEGSSIELVNFVKLRKTAIIIKQMQLFQQTSYSLEVVAPIQTLLDAVRRTNLNEDDAYLVSLKVEPRDPVAPNT
jgi:son of sevenless-like protein